MGFFGLTCCETFELIYKRRIFLPDGSKMTINQVTRRISDKTGHDPAAVREHVMSWLEEAADSDDPERDDDMQMGEDISRWINDARRSSQELR